VALEQGDTRMERVMLTFIACLAAGLVLAAIWAFVSFGSTFEAFEDRVTAFIQNLTGG
jgi:hypothetical protein